MVDKLLPLLAFTGVMLVSLGLGRLTHRLLGRPFGVGLTLTRILGNAFLGTAVLVLCLSTWFHLGGTATQLRWPLIAIAPVLAALGIHDLVRTLGRPGLRRPALMLGCGGVVMIAWLYLPVALGSVANYVNDTPTYTIIARWLQENAFTTPVQLDGGLASTSQVAGYQQFQLRMGAIFLLASCQTLAAGADIFLLYLGILCWGTMLNLAAIYLLSRWGLGFTPSWSAAVGLLAGVTLSPLYVSALGGFFPQQFGTAYLVFFLALLARCSRPAFWRPSQAVALGLAAATLVSVYSELMPVAVLVGFGTAGCLVWSAARVGQCRRYLAFVGLVLAAALVLGHLEWLRAANALPFQMKSRCGGYVNWPWFTFWGMALNLAANLEPIGQPVQWFSGVLIGAASVALLAGLAGRFRRRGTPAFGLSLAVFGAMAIYFLCIPDPFLPEKRGHSWSLYKVVQWASPVILPAVCAGWFPLVLRGRYQRRRLALIALALLAWSSRELLYFQTFKAYQLKSSFAARDLPRAWREINARLDELNIRDIYYLTASQDLFPDLGLCHVLYPHRFVNGWPNPSIAGYMQADRPGESLPPGATPLLWGNPPFPVRGANLPGRLIALDPAQPHLVALLSSQGQALDLPKANHEFRQERQPITFLVWSPHAGRVVLSCRPLDGVIGSWAGLRWVGSHGETPTEAADGEHAKEFTWNLPAGYSRLQLLPAKNQARPSTAGGLTELGTWRVSFADDSDPGGSTPTYACTDVQGQGAWPTSRLEAIFLRWSHRVRRKNTDVWAAVILLSAAGFWTWRCRSRMIARDASDAPPCASRESAHL